MASSKPHLTPVRFKQRVLVGQTVYHPGMVAGFAQDVADSLVERTMAIEYDPDDDEPGDDDEGDEDKDEDKGKSEGKPASKADDDKPKAKAPDDDSDAKPDKGKRKGYRTTDVKPSDG